MKKLISIIFALCATTMAMAQNQGSFVVADKDGNSFLVRSLIFQRDETEQNYSWSTEGFENRYQKSLDISKLQFIARINEEIATASADEVTEMLEELSGTDEGDAEVIAASLQNNPNVEEAYTADGNNLIVKSPDDEGFVIYPMYEMKAPFSELPDIDEQMSKTSRMPDKVAHAYNNVAIFNLFDGMQGYEVQNKIVKSIELELRENQGYDVVCYTPNNVKEEQKFTYKNVGDVLIASRDYAAILIFSHGARDIDGTHYFCTGEIGSDGEKRFFVDGKKYKGYSTNIRAENNCILYLGVCDGLEKDKFRDSCPIIGYSGKTCMAQANAAILLDLLLKENYTLKEAIDILPKEPEPNENTKVYCSTGVGMQKLEAKEEWKTEYNLRYSVDIKRAYNNYYPDDDTWEHLVYGKLSGVNESEGFFVRTRLYPVLYSNWWENMDNVSPKSAIDENDLFKTVIDIDGMPEGIYKYRIEGTTYHDYFNDKYSFANIKPIKHRFAICSKNFKENSAELIPSRADYFTPMILDANGLSLEEISLPAGTSKKFTIDGYNGHTFKAISLKTNIADVSVEGNTLTVKGGVEGSTYIGVYDQQNLQMAVAKVTVTEGQAFDGQIVMERKYWVNTTDDYHGSDFYCAERFSYQECYLTFDNGVSVAVGYHNAYYWDDSYDNHHLGVYIMTKEGRKDGDDGTWSEEWYVAPLQKGEWVNEKLAIDRDGTVHYYMNGQDMGSHRFNALGSLDGMKSLMFESYPYGWWYTHYHYMDDFKLTTPTQVISDDFNDGVLNTAIWQNPLNPDGVREEEGIMKQEQLRTDVNFGLRSHPIDLTGTGGATDLSAGLVAYYPFNGNTNDESGYGNNVVSSDGDISLTVGVTGNQEGAYHFNGGRMEVLNSESLQFSRACTFSAYIRPTEYTSSDGYSCGCVVGKSYDQVGATMLEYDIWKDSISTNIGIHGNNVNYNYIDQNRQRLGVKGDFLNKWIHIANVIDGNRALYYINGKLVWEHAITTPEFFNTVNQNDMFIGKNRAGWYGMRGDIDEVRIYNRALSPSEVQQLAVYGEEPQTDQPIAQNGCPDGNHPHMIDLGLPSGTKWACCNVGASSPEEYGDYFAWGETEPKDEYNWDTYKYCNGSDDTMTKYCFESNYGYNGFTDNLTELLPEDDAATANWGSGWQMPSTEQLEELIYNEYTTTEWTKQNGVNGLLITSEVNGNSLFLRAAGYRYDTSLEYAGVYGLYWPRSLGTGRSYGVRSLHIDSMINYASNCHRCCGFSVRPVCAQN